MTAAKPVKAALFASCFHTAFLLGALVRLQGLGKLKKI
jgi:hypothetical protein